jgi:hypothetical protein
MRRLASLVAILTAVALLLPAGARAAAAPRDFFGVMADGPVFDSPTGFEREAPAMRSAGVGVVRVAVYWNEIQPYASAADVPDGERDRFTATVGGRPADLQELDGIMATAARRRLVVMPVVLRTPTWAAASPGDIASPPRRVSDYARFVGGLVARYGHGGSFWREHPELVAGPVRRWQIWNEPDLAKYWSRQPFVRSYLKLLRAARDAVRRNDRRAQVVMAGLTNKSWEGLRRLYRAGARGLFDVAAIHPFSRYVRNVVEIVRRARVEMARAGDARTPLLLSEVSWSSGKGRASLVYGWETSERGQAARLREAVTAFVRERVRLRLAGFFWYTWLSPQPGSAASFDYGGLRRLSPDGKVVDKPALVAFRGVVRRYSR